MTKKELNFNQQMRVKITDALENIMVEKYCPLKDAIALYAQTLYPLFDIADKNKPIEVFKEFFSEIIYLDAYKMYSYKQKKGIATDIEIERFSQIYQLEDSVDLSTEISANPEFFCTLIAASSDFSNLSALGKIMITESLSEGENKKLLEIAPIHETDLIQYKKDITIENLMKQIKGQRTHYHKIMMIEFEEGHIYSLLGFIEEYYKVQPERTKKLVQEIAIIDYTTIKYLQTENQEDQFEERIKFYETQTVENVLQTMLKEQDILFEAIKICIARLIDKEYGDIDLNHVSEDPTNPAVKKLKKQ